MRVFLAVLAAALSLLSSVCALAQNFYPIKQQEFLGNVNGLFTTGEQYRDTATNGVLQNSWSMLVRWQGGPGFISNYLSDDLGNYTGFHVPDPKGTWQRGPQGANAGVQLYGTQAGMLINTLAVPHRLIEGGGYNDMYGYAWAESQRPDAFLLNNGTALVPSDLVLQANIAVPYVHSLQPASGGGWEDCGNSGECADHQVGFFAYLEDRTHMNLPPIALVVLAYHNAGVGCGGTGSVGRDYPTGVWFGSSNICTTDITTAITSTATQNTPFSDLRFFRIHITRQNWINLINRINTFPGCQTIGCPPNGYSTSPDDYRIQYAGVIAEIVLLERNANNALVSSNASTIRQGVLGTTIQDVGIYRATGNPAVASTVTALSGGGQVTTLNQLFQYPLHVRVTDAGGNPVNGATVTFSGPASGASTNPVQAAVVTNYLGEATFTPTANGIAGSYTATATSSGASPAYFTLTNNTAPGVSLMTNGTTFTPASPVVMTAAASDPDGSIGQVAFYANGQLLAVDNAAPYTFSWNAPTGNYQLVAIAWDNYGAYAYSNYVNIVVNADPSCTPGPVTLDYSGSPIAPNTVTGDITAYEPWTITFSFSAAAGSLSSLRELYNSYYSPQPDRMTWSVSKCKGDFSGTGLCHPGVQYANGGIDVAAYSSPGACQVEPNVTYYLNLRVDTCSSPPCGFRMQRIN